MDLNWIEKENTEEEKNTEILSYEEYLEYFREFNRRELRPSYQYLIEMLDYFKKDDRNHFKLFQEEHSDSPAVFGQYKTQEAIYQNLINFQEEGFNNKFILLVGPNGSSKSSIIRKFMKGAELFSESEEGKLYSFSWVFPIDHYTKGSLGINVDTSTRRATNNLQSFAHLEDKDINAILNSELKDHPLMLIPIKYRREFIDECLADDQDYLDSIRKSYLYNGDLSKRNRMIYDALLKNYKGSHEDVLKHIRIERFKISKRYSNGAVTIEPQLHVDARLQQITMDKRLASLPPSLQSLNLFSMQGEAVMANRGILEFSDLLKRPLDTYKYLLMTMETGSINLQGILTQLDIFFAGTSNEIHLAAFKQHPDYNSFKGRFNFIRVPYLLDYKEEIKIYNKQVHGLKERSTFEPHSLEAICLFGVMTRLRSCQGKTYTDKKLSKITAKLNPLDKALFLSEDTKIPEHLDVESKQILKQGKSDVVNEYEFENLYEGKFGLSPRDIKKFIYKLSNKYKNITFIEVFEELHRLIQKKNDYDFLNMTAQGDYHHPARFIGLLKEHCLSIFDKSLRESLGLVDDRSYDEYLKKYIENVNSLIKGEKIKNQITGKYEEYDQYFIKEFEQNINLKDNPETYRSHLISRLGAFYLDNPGIKKIDYTEVFPDVVEKLQESFRNEQKKFIKNISKNIVYFEAEISEDESKSTPLAKKEKEEIQRVLTNLQEKYQYSEQGALSLLKYIIKERY